MTITESNIVLNRTGERIISADSHVAITQDQVKANRTRQAEGIAQDV
jgi:hypothetical protein